MQLWRDGKVYFGNYSNVRVMYTTSEKSDTLLNKEFMTTISGLVNWH